MLIDFGAKFLKVEFERELDKELKDFAKLNKKEKNKYLLLAIQFYLKSDPFNKRKIIETSSFNKMDITLHEICSSKIQEYTSELFKLTGTSYKIEY